MIPKGLLEDTEKRFLARADARHESQDKIKAGMMLNASPPELVQERLRRLSSSPAAAAAPRGIVDGAPPAAPRPDVLALERFMGKNDLLGVAYLDLAERAARSVGRIRINTAPNRLFGYGTGFMVSPRLLLTNNHVLPTAELAAYSQVDFNYQDDLNGQPLPSVVFDLEPGVLFCTSKDFDYTLVAVGETSHDGREQLPAFGWLKLSPDQAKVIAGEALNIIQHPNGEPKQVALRANTLIDLLDNYLHYETDTAPGSSGSPVFNDQWEVVGLHHSGVPRRDAQNNILTREGQIWTEDMGEQRIDWIANEGVRIGRILDDARQQGLPDPARKLIDALAQAAPAPVPGPGLLAQPPARIETVGLQAATAVPVDVVPGETVVTIPLQVIIRMGQPALAGAAPPAPPAIAAAPKPAAAESPELKAALAELAKAPEKRYFDEAQDAKDAAGYYAALPDNLDPAGLYTALSTLLERTHANRPRYKPGIEVYPWIDLQPNLKIRSIYSGREYDAETLIRDDARVAQERADRLNEMMRAEAALSPRELQERFDALEASLPYNCEHVVCQSWFDKAEPMRGDLHHLFACESNCNSFRGNTPYFDFPDFQEVVRTDCGKREPQRFEPGASKGTVARVALYFLLRYPKTINAVMQVYDKDRLKMLLDWHAANPVTEHEKHRNQAIFQRQGNRNPLIDHPEWAEKIAFEAGL